MRTHIVLCSLVAGALALTAPPLRGAEAAPPDTTQAEPTGAAAELKALVARINAKLKEGKPTEAGLSPELKEFTALFEKHRDEKTDDVARILYMEAMLYQQVLENSARATELAQQLKRDFGDTALGKKADAFLDSIKKQDEARTVRNALVVGAKFPDFDEKDVDGKPLSIASYKGKVVLLDFWATWCGPCVHELPNVIATYQKHHGKGFDIIGVSLDEDEKKLQAFREEKKMTWQQFFDGKGWSNKLAVKYGVQSIPATFLLDVEGKIIGSDLRGEDSGTSGREGPGPAMTSPGLGLHQLAELWGGPNRIEARILAGLAQQVRGLRVCFKSLGTQVYRLFERGERFRPFSQIGLEGGELYQASGLSGLTLTSLSRLNSSSVQFFTSANTWAIPRIMSAPN